MTINKKFDKRKLKIYLEFKETSVKSKPKLDDINHYITDFMNSKEKNINDFSEIDLIFYINSLKKFKTRTKNTIKAYVKHFIKWNFPDWSLRFPNIEKICRQEKPEQAYQPEQMLSKEDIQLLVQGENKLFWKVYFLLLFYGGFRPTELCTLKWTQITFEDEGCFIKIFSNKNKEYFNKFIPAEVTHYLKKIQNNNSVWVFPSIQNGNVSINRKVVYLHLRILSERVLKKRINPYIFRHSIATILYNRDDLKDDDVAKQMGHTKDMKKVYSQLSEKTLKDRARKIWIKPEDLPPEKKQEIEKKFEEFKLQMKKEMEDRLKKMNEDLKKQYPNAQKEFNDRRELIRKMAIELQNEGY